MEIQYKAGEIPIYKSRQGIRLKYVTLPQFLGGKKVRVLETTIDQCPCDKHVANILHLKDYIAAECPEKGFLWYKK